MPMGYSFNLDGSMMYCTFAVLFIAQAYDIELPIGTQITMLLILMLTSKGMAGVPRASLVVIAATLNQFNIPEAGLLLILGVDTFLDMGRSATNAVGNSIATAVVAKWEGELLPEAEADAQRADARYARRAVPCTRDGRHARRPRRRRRLLETGRAGRSAPAAGARGGPRGGAGACAIGADAGAAHRDARQGARQRRDHARATASRRFPFSYLSARGEPIGYSIELCKLLVDAIGEEVGRELAIKWQPVTPEIAHRRDRVGPERPRMRLDHEQSRAPQAGGLLADRSSSPAPSCW